MIQSKASDFYGYPDTVTQRSDTKTQNFQRNNCSGGQVGSLVPYSKTYNITGTQADLEAMIVADESNFNVEGQTNANTYGNCMTTCAENRINIPIGTLPRLVTGVNASNRYYLDCEAVGAPFDMNARANKLRLHPNFHDLNAVVNSTFFNAYTWNANHNISYQFRRYYSGLAEIWQHAYSDASSPCNIGTKWMSLPNNTIYAIPFATAPSTGMFTGVIAFVLQDVNNGRNTKVIFIDRNSSNEITELGSITTKTSDYAMWNANIHVAIDGDTSGGIGVYIAIVSKKNKLNSAGNLGVWYTNFLNPFRPPGPPIFKNTQAWIYGKEIKFGGLVANPNGHGAMLILYHKDLFWSGGGVWSGIKLHNNGYSTIVYIDSTDYSSTAFICNNSDGRAYWFAAGKGNSYKRYDFGTGTWSNNWL